MNFIHQIAIWLSFKLSIVFIVGLPITLLFWAIKKKDKAIMKLLSNYWKISILFFISLILFIGKENNSLIVFNLSTLLMSISTWFWTDINLELGEYNLWNPISITTKIWRWGLTLITINFLIITLNHSECINLISSPSCKEWLRPSENLYKMIKYSFNFLFGANFSEPVAKFLGLFSLGIYILGLIQWLAIKLPKTGRNSGFSNIYDN
ncbi:MAG: hypothetical protein CMK49_00455 [Prochlorococcus sp. SP3034]|nr:hypothetical protein [Prochlorococcus sp. SP3034]